jgi:hypothetical protein
MRRIDEDQHLKVMIEAMSREGRSEREIVAAVQQAGGPAYDRKGGRGDSPRPRGERS